MEERIHPVCEEGSEELPFGVYLPCDRVDDVGFLADWSEALDHFEELAGLYSGEPG